MKTAFLPILFVFVIIVQNVHSLSDTKIVAARIEVSFLKKQLKILLMCLFYCIVFRVALGVA